MVVAGLTALLHDFEEVKVAGSVSNAFEAIPFLKSNDVDLVLLDINLPDISGIDLCRKITKDFPGVKVLGISTFGERSYISRMIENGASGYLIKNASAAEIQEAIETVMAGKLYLSVSIETLLKSKNNYAEIPALTKREKEILSLISEGYTTNQIAEKLFISPLTVESHRKNLLTKLNVNNTASLIRLAVNMNLV
jgi:two-component system nitrate/nitrite response regulator NarL